MVGNTIATARANGARIVPPGTVHNFGPILPLAQTDDLGMAEMVIGAEVDPRHRRSPTSTV
jgi:hypothetical protein